MKISILGTGYVGLVTGTCLANFGLSVTCVDNDQEKINQLNDGIVPIKEPNLEELIQKNVKENRLSFTTDMKRAIQEAQVIYIAVGTPPNHDGSASLRQVEDVAAKIAQYINGYKVIVNKCTVPVGTARKIKQMIKESHCEERSDEAISSSPLKENHPNNSSPLNGDFSDNPYPLNGDLSSNPSTLKGELLNNPSPQKEYLTNNPSPLKGDFSKNSSPLNEDLSNNPSPLRGDLSNNPSPSRGEGRVRVKHPFDIISNPEFLREGSAVYDFTHPDKIVIGYESEKAKQIMQEIYRPLYLLDTPFVFTNFETAEMIKYACNAFLATKITFINEMANLCDRVGADINQIAKAMGMDGRISPKFLHPGPGFGGSCFPKDTRALQATAHDYHYDFKLINAVIEANSRQREIVVNKIELALHHLKDKTIAILGLAFKQNTDDIRESAALDIIQMLLQKGARIQCFDPLAMENTKKVLPELTYCRDEYDTSKDADALVILTEWNQFRNLDLNKIKNLMIKPILIDSKNLYEPSRVKEYGFTYISMGRN